MAGEIKSLLARAEIARLIPTVADSKKEERATSCLLASFMAVPAYAREVLSNAGAPVGKRLKAICYTEVVFKTTEKTKKLRPDGLIVITNGSKQWTALVESKIGNSELSKEQIEEYLDLAKKNGIDAIVTISNQFATTPTHHPVKVSKNKLRSVELYHFSWLSLKSMAVLLTSNKGVDDPEQAYILSELVRYLDHDSSGISALSKMPSNWKDVCNRVQQGATLNKNSDIVENSVSGWHQLLRYLSLNLSMSIGQPVSIVLTRSRDKNPDLNFSEDCSFLSKECSLSAEFDIPNAASKLLFTADFLRRTINISMKLEAPKDKSRATASINWITRQLKDRGLGTVLIRAYWPKRIQMTSVSLEKAIENPASLIPPNTSELPVFLEVVRVIDLAARFKGAKTFVEEVSKEFPDFYEDVGQHLTKWVAKAPKVKESVPSLPSIPTIFSDLNVVIEESSNVTNASTLSSLVDSVAKETNG